MDERFFLYCEEPDLCLRIRRGGWDVRHVPTMTIVHYVGNAGLNEQLVAQDAFARRSTSKSTSPSCIARPRSPPSHPVTC
jgi:hypothetical protein